MFASHRLGCGCKNLSYCLDSSPSLFRFWLLVKLPLVGRTWHLTLKPTSSIDVNKPWGSLFKFIQNHKTNGICQFARTESRQQTIAYCHQKRYWCEWEKDGDLGHPTLILMILCSLTTRLPMTTVARKKGTQTLEETSMQSHMDSIHSPHSTRKTIMKL